MPIDPSLITGTMANWQAPPPIPGLDPLANYAKLQALKNGIVQQQMQQQALQSGALELQEKQLEISGRAALGDAIRNNITQGADGAPAINHSGVIQSLAQTHPELIEGYQKGVAAKQKADAERDELQLKNQASSLDLATRAFGGAKDQASWDHAIGAAHGLGIDTEKLGIPAVYSPEAQTQVLQYGMSIKDQLAAKAAALTAAARGKTADVAADKLSDERIERALSAAAGATNQDELDALRSQAIRAGASPAQVGSIPTQFSPEAMTAYGRARLTPEQRTQADQAALNARNLEADRKVTQQQAADRLKVEQQNAGINAKKFALEFGGDAVKGWAKQVADNPDTANQVPPGLRTSVMQAFTAQTGLPFPKPLTGNAVEQERASRNALDAVAQVKAALADPEIQKRIGPILGRLGSAEQAAGTAIGLTPEQEAKAQQLRTNMRYLVFQEGKALLGGRMPQQLMESLEKSSPNVAMDAGTLNGALAGVTDAAGRNLDQTYKQRFGEKATRPGSAAAAAIPDWKKQAAAAPIGTTIPLPGGRKVLKTGENQYQPIQ